MNKSSYGIKTNEHELVADKLARPALVSNKVWLTFLAYYAMAAFGFCVVITGSALPQIVSALGITASQAGLLTSMWGLGFLLCTTVGGSLADRLSKQGLLLAGVIMMVVSLFMFGSNESFWFNLFFQFLLGSGCGIFEGVLNALIVKLHPKSPGTALNILHAMLGVGTVGGPILTGVILDSGYHYRCSFMAVGVFCAFLFPFILIAAFPKADPEARRASPFSILAHLVRLPAFIFLCAAMAFYIAVEFGITVWLTTYLAKVKAVQLSHANRILSLVWAGLLAGRFAAGMAHRKFSGRAIVAALSLFAIVAFAVGLNSVSPFQLGAAFFLFGAGLSGIFPTLLSIAGENNPELAGTSMGLIISIGYIGGMVIPSAIALVSESIGLGYAMYLYLADIGLLLCSIIGYSAIKKHT